MTTSTLLLILCIPIKLTTASCSKVPQGLRFPLGVRGLFTTRCVQKGPTRDSDNLVKPFMHVAIQTTRHYATLSKLLLSTLMSYDLDKSRRVCASKPLHVSMQIGLYHHELQFSSCLACSL